MSDYCRVIYLRGDRASVARTRVPQSPAVHTGITIRYGLNSALGVSRQRLINDPHKESKIYSTRGESTCASAAAIVIPRERRHAVGAGGENVVGALAPVKVGRGRWSLRRGGFILKKGSGVNSSYENSRPSIIFLHSNIFS